MITHNPLSRLPDTLIPICSNAVRLQFLHESCRSISQSNHAVLHRRGTYKHILCDDVNHMLFCDAPKVGSTYFKTLWLNYTRDVASPVSQVHKWNYLRRHGLRYLSSYNHSEIKTRLRTYFKFMMVRHPLVRLLSVYREKLESPNRYYRNRVGRFIENSIGGIPFNDTTGDDVTFVQFVEFFVRGYARKKDHHWKPVTDLCHPCEIHYDYIVRLETSYADYLQVFFKLKNAPDSKAYLLESMAAFKAGTDRERITKYYSQIPAEWINILRRIYRFDMNLFGYTWDDMLLTYGCQVKRNGSECC